MKARQYLRVPVPITLRYRLIEGEDDFKPAVVRDISWGGILMEINPPPEVGARIIVEFVLAEENVSLELWGTVVRIDTSAKGKPKGAGIEFDRLDEDSRSLIQRLVQEEVLTLLLKSV